MGRSLLFGILRVAGRSAFTSGSDFGPSAMWAILGLGGQIGSDDGLR